MSAAGLPSRRGFLAGGTGLAGLVGLGSLAAGCDLKAARARMNAGPSRKVSATGQITWRLYQNNAAITVGLPPERDATLRVLAPSGRVSPQVLAGFARAHRAQGCRVQLTTFPTIGQALTALTSTGAGRKSAAAFDVLLGLRPDQIGGLIWNQLLQPLNSAYLPNLAHLLPRYQNPYYDQQNRYTVSFTVFTAGLAYRRDLLDANPDLSAAGWALPWQARFRGNVAILDNYRESLCLGLLASGFTDLSTPDPRIIDDGQAALLDLIGRTAARVSSNVSVELATGRTALHHAWSGQAIAANALLPKGVAADVIGYWFPLDGKGPVGSDTGAIPRAAHNPVLAHRFLNYLLDPANAVANFRSTGFQPPLQGLTPSRMVREGLLPSSLISAAYVDERFSPGLKELPLSGPADLLWQQAWSVVRSKALH